MSNNKGQEEQQRFVDAYNKAVDLQTYDEFEKAYKLLVPLVEKWGRASEQNILGDMYYGGLGVSQSYKKAMKWFRLSAEQGDAKAQNALAYMYTHKEGVFFRDYKEAVKWYRLSAEQENAEGQVGLGAMYADGLGVSQDHEEAVKWYRLSAEQGHSGAQYNLGLLYDNGQGVPHDYKEAVRLYRLAAKKGVTNAQTKLGEMYSKGQGVEQDYVLGCAWIYLARFKLDQFDQSAMKDIDRMEEKMTPAQIVEAQKTAKTWRNAEMNGRPFGQ